MTPTMTRSAPREESYAEAASRMHEEARCIAKWKRLVNAEDLLDELSQDFEDQMNELLRVGNEAAMGRFIFAVRDALANRLAQREMGL